MLAERTVFVDGQSPDAAPRAVLIVLHSPYATRLLLGCYFIATSLLLGCDTVVFICFPYDPLVARGCYLMLADVGRRCDQTMTDVVMRLRCTGVSMFDVDFAGYEQVVGGNPESKSASRSVCQDSDCRDPVV